MNQSDTGERLRSLAIERADSSGSAYFVTGELRDRMTDPKSGERPSNKIIRRMVWLAIRNGYVGAGSHNRRLVLPD